MLRTSLFTTLVSISLIFGACSETPTQNSDVNTIVKSKEFVLISTDNKQYIVKKENDGFVVENAKGKVIIFDIFATWCPPCQESASHLTSLQKQFKDDLLVIGITIEDGIANAKLDAFKEEYGAEYSIVNSSSNRPLVNEIAESLDLGKRFPIPLMAIYKDGKLINHYLGEVQEEFVASDIKEALEQ